jgi:anti-sigma B factor antagonist
VDLQIEEREREGIVILDLKGKLVRGSEDLMLLQRLLLLHEHKRLKVIVNLKEVSCIDNSGLETLVFSATRFGDAGGSLVVLSFDDSSAADSDAPRLRTSLKVYEEELDAVNSFFPERVVPSSYDILEFVKEQQVR